MSTNIRQILDPVFGGPRRMSQQLKAVLIIVESAPSIRNRLLSIIDQENETIYWDDLNYGVLSGGEKAAASWVYSVWTDAPVPAGWRDPFEGFGVMGPETQAACLTALAFRHALRPQEEKP